MRGWAVASHDEWAEWAPRKADIGGLLRAGAPVSDEQMAFYTTFEPAMQHRKILRQLRRELLEILDDHE